MGDTKKENDNIMEFGQAILHADRRNTTIYLLSIIGEIEGHECLPSTSKTTKYEHVLPRLAAIEDDESVNGVLLLLNTMGGDVESGLADHKNKTGYKCIRSYLIEFIFCFIHREDNYTVPHSGILTHSMKNHLPFHGLPSGSTGACGHRKYAWNN